MNTTKSHELERLIRIESKLSRLMETVGVSPRLDDASVTVRQNRNGEVEAEIDALAVTLGQILTTVNEKFPTTEDVWIVHRGRDVCCITNARS